jgi:D-3-phosphoglycerate dehydrogenase
MNILVTSRQMQNYLATVPGLFSGHKVITPKITKEYFSETELSSIVTSINIMIVGDDEITSTIIKLAKDLKLIVKWGVGTDSIDLETAKKFGVSVQNTPGLFGESVAELAISYVLCLSRSTVRIDREVRTGVWPKHEGNDLRDKKVGIFGFGAIGSRIAELLGHFGCQISYFDPYLSEENTRYRRFKSVTGLAEFSDFLILAAPLNDDTRGIIDSGVLKLMKKRSFLINVSRGGLVIEEDLISALNENWISGAALDVYENEPITYKSKLLKMSNVVLGSHNGSNTYEGNLRASNRAGEIVSEYLLNFR